jgi:hypothetical protein
MLIFQHCNYLCDLRKNYLTFLSQPLGPKKGANMTHLKLLDWGKLDNTYKRCLGYERTCTGKYMHFELLNHFKKKMIWCP